MGCGFSLQSVLGALSEVARPLSSGLATSTSPNEDVGGGSGGETLYETLPDGAEPFQVRNVYDGDTLTLIDERRVRFLGIDTPELKEQQPFAAEAKEYTKGYCHKKEIYLLQDGTDHYDRVLGHIFVKTEDGKYLCVNEGIVEQGFAFAYIPNKDSKPFNWQKLVDLQAGARSAKRGVWSDFEDSDVVATANGAAYHLRTCEHISKIKNLTELKVSQATDRGLHPCRTCIT
eukprot:CAMPEP_0194222718 /NCGR_PEP_ID=MMETSP0156-20130528/33622_1 /TAXON_ID=33649 /ORGANISM="Thalassionema nitzschioides, Strain L26-B" /LENGTH=230 /DNA_ID=CAMNT_0038953633 /DNA_START=23 /DNA_END=715 /DNA_ORIENTATION=-